MMRRKKGNRRLYVLIDESLDPIYGCVQGGHAVAQYMLERRFFQGVYGKMNISFTFHAMCQSGKISWKRSIRGFPLFMSQI